MKRFMDRGRVVRVSENRQAGLVNTLTGRSGCIYGNIIHLPERIFSPLWIIRHNRARMPGR